MMLGYLNVGIVQFLLFESYNLFWMAWPLFLFSWENSLIVFEHGILKIYLYGSSDTLQADNPWWVKGFNIIILLIASAMASDILPTVKWVIIKGENLWFLKIGLDLWIIF